MTKQPPDWLREFPLAVIPESWALNDIFLEKLKDVEALWLSHGYRLQLGLELEFYVRENKTFRTALETKLKQKKKASEDLLAPLRSTGPYQEVLENLRAFVDTEEGKALLTRTGKTRDNFLDYLKDYETHLKVKNPQHVSIARMNIFLAHIHSFKSGHGGLSDLIEPRFGDEPYGIGWHDGVPEIRTEILDGPLEVISHYHRYLDILYREAPSFGLTIEATNPQYHLSIIRLKDSKNMMKMDDEESIAFCEQALSGYYHGLRDTSFMILDHELHDRPFNFYAGTVRESHLRILPDNWELRSEQLGEYTHVARSLMITLMGMAQGCLLQQGAKHPLPVRRLSHLRASHPQKPLSGIASILEHCIIKPDGNLQPNLNLISKIQWRLNEEISSQHAGGYVVQPPMKENIYYDLSHPYAWFELLKKIKVTPDNKLDTTDIVGIPAVQQALKDIAIEGRWTSLEVPPHRITTESHMQKENLEAFRASDLIRHFFTPEEKQKISEFYAKLPGNDRKNANEKITRIFNDELNITRKAFAEIRKALGKGGKLLSIEENYAARNAYKFCLAAAAIDIDADEAQIRELEGLIKKNRIVPRSEFTERPSYFRYLQGHFVKALDCKIDSLRQQEAPDKNDMQALLICRRVFRKYWVESLGTADLHIKDFSAAIKSGDIFRQYGSDIDIITGICNRHSQGIYSFVIMALRDPEYKDTDMLLDIDDLIKGTHEHFITLEEELAEQPDRELSMFVFKLYRDSVTKRLSDTRTWLQQNFPPGEISPAEIPPMTPFTTLEELSP